MLVLDCFDVKIPPEVDPFFNGSRAWFDTNYNKASSGMKDKEVEIYDSDYFSATPRLLEEYPVSKFLDLPSIHTWLLQKVARHHIFPLHMANVALIRCSAYEAEAARGFLFRVLTR